MTAAPAPGRRPAREQAAGDAGAPGAPVGPSGAASSAAPVHGGRRPGRPRDARARRAILAAARAVLARDGFAGLTVDAVAAEAGVGKATIYRRWPGKERLVLDAVREVTAPVAMPDTGDLRGDLAAFTEVMAGEAAQADIAQLLPGLAAAAVHNPDLRRELVAYADERRAHVLRAFERAVARGEVRPGADLALAVEQIVGPVVYRLVIAGEPPRPDDVARMVDHLLGGIGAVNRPVRRRPVR